MSRATMNKTIRGVGASGSAVITASDGTNSATATIQCRPAGEIDIDSPLDQVTMGNSVTYTYTFLNADGTPGAAEPTISIDDPTVATISDKTYDTTTGEGSFKANGVKSATERATTIRMLGSAGGQIISADIEVIAKKPTGAFDAGTGVIQMMTYNMLLPRTGTYTGAYSDRNNYTMIAVDGATEVTPTYIENPSLTMNSDGTFSYTFTLGTPSEEEMHQMTSGKHVTFDLYLVYNLLGSDERVARQCIDIGGF